MGKFLKIIRYIANLIAIMGTCFSKAQQNEPSSNLTKPLLNDQTEGSDFNPVQGVSANKPANRPEVEAFLSSHVGKTEFWKRYFTHFWTETCHDGPYMFQKRKGNIPFRLMNNDLRPIMSLQMMHYLSSKTNVVRTSTGFVIVIDDISRKLENFDLLLSHQISEGDFKLALVKNNPDCYKQIWDILTSGGPFVALYY